MSDDRHIDQTASMAPASDPRRVAREHQSRAREDHPKQIGPYKVLEVLGEGGMGTVYLAEQEKPIHRRVALKIIKLGMDTKSVIARFEAEREALAVMDHPNVARVYDAGATEQGRPYFVMEYVKGIPITDYCDKHRLSTEERLRLFMDVCHAVQHAHQKGIIHRDIKPSNVLVTVQDDKPIVKVIDFGVAKATQHRLTEQTVFTEHGQLIGTPGYMSPEQAEMTALDIDTRTDIYSLGVLLYELLVGMRPFDDDLLQRAAIGEIQRIIREMDPPKPSTRLSALQSEPRPSGSGHVPDEEKRPPLPHGRGSVQVRTIIEEIARARHTEPKTLARQIRGDLDWIVMKCLEKDRTRRYDTANALAIELQRYLKNEPVLAGPPSASYRIWKFVRRNRASVAAALALSVILVAGVAATTAMYARAERARGQALLERDRADSEAEAAKQIASFLIELFEIPAPSESRGNSITAREILDRASARLDKELHDQPELQASLMATAGKVYGALGLYRPAKELLVNAVETRRRALSPQHPKLAETLTALAKILVYTNEFEEAIEAGEEAVRIFRLTRGNEDAKTADAVLALASVFSSKGDYDRARADCRVAIQIQKAVFGEESVEVAKSFSSLGNLLRIAGSLAEAEEVLRQSVTILEREHGSDHPDTLIANNNLAIVLGDAGRNEEALSLAKEVFDTGRRVLGNDHFDVAGWQMNLATYLQNLERYAEAEVAFRGALGTAKRSIGPEHPHIAYFANNLGRVLQLQEKHQDAKQYLQEAYQGCIDHYGPDHMLTSIAGLNLSRTLMALQRWSDAERTLNDLNKVALGTTGDALAQIMHAECLLMVGRHRSAEAVLLPTVSHSSASQDHALHATTLLTLLYESWDAAEPDAGYDVKAAEWRAKVDEVMQPQSDEGTEE